MSSLLSAERIAASSMQPFFSCALSHTFHWSSRITQPSHNNITATDIWSLEATSFWPSFCKAEATAESSSRNLPARASRNVCVSPCSRCATTNNQPYIPHLPCPRINIYVWEREYGRDITRQLRPPPASSRK